MARYTPIESLEKQAKGLWGKAHTTYTKTGSKRAYALMSALEYEIEGEE